MAVLLRLGDAFVQQSQQAAQPAGGQLGQRLRAGQQDGPVQILRAPLGGRVEGTHGVHLVPPELGPDRGVHGGGEHVQDAASQGKLAGTLHLLAAGIAGGGETGGQVVEIDLLAGGQLQGGLFEDIGRQGALLEGLHRGHQAGQLSLRQSPQQLQAPVLPLVGDGGGVVEGKLPGGEHRHTLAGEEGQVPGHALALAFIGAYYHHGPLRGRAQGGGKVGPVYRTQAGHRRRGLSPVQRGQQLLEFRQVL